MSGTPQEKAIEWIERLRTDEYRWKEIQGHFLGTRDRFEEEGLNEEKRWNKFVCALFRIYKEDNGRDIHCLEFIAGLRHLYRDPQPQEHFHTLDTLRCELMWRRHLRRKYFRRWYLHILRRKALRKQDLFKDVHLELLYSLDLPFYREDPYYQDFHQHQGIK